jgi:hypothetical protein
LNFFYIFSTARLASPLAGSMRTPSHASLARSARQPEAFLSNAANSMQDLPAEVAKKFGKVVRLVKFMGYLFFGQDFD